MQLSSTFFQIAQKMIIIRKLSFQMCLLDPFGKNLKKHLHEQDVDEKMMPHCHPLF